MGTFAAKLRRSAISGTGPKEFSTMFDTLTDKFSSVFRSLSGRGKISEENIRESMREVRTALLEADVNFQVVKEFTDKVVEKAIGQHVIDSLQPEQLMVKIVYDELLELLGPVDTRIYFVQPGPTVIMMCGLQGRVKRRPAASSRCT
jgi:signal recognition particle subunit SRP54